MRMLKTRRGMTWDQIIKASIAVIVFLVIFAIFNMGTSHAPTAVFNAQMKTRIAECSVASGGTDSDGDGMPDTCDPCVDVHNGWAMSEEEYGSKIKQGDDASWPGLRDIQIGNPYFDDDVESPDNDGDGLPDLCEMTLKMEWALDHPILSILTSGSNPDLDGYIDPKDASDKMYCKYWYSEFQCCSRQGDEIHPIKEDGTEDTTKTLKCYPHDKRPK